MVKKILIWIIRRYNLDDVFTELKGKKTKQFCYTISKADGAFYYPETVIYNQQNNPEKIFVGMGTHVRGMLHIFRYGGEIKIGCNCYIGDHSRIWSGEKVTIGNYVQISHNVNIIDTTAHEFDANERAERYIELVNNGPWEKKGNVLTSPIIIGDYAWVSFNASILRGVSIGEGAIVGACSVVTKDVPPYTLVAGNPARVIKTLIRPV
jgi:acetyltransferase-like isoleucine patch superfamily enzyme